MALCIQKMSENNNQQVFDISIDVVPKINGSKCFDDDGRLKRTGGFSNPSPVLFPLSQTNIVVCLYCMYASHKICLLFNACRKCMDRKCTHNNGCDWIWGAFLGMGHCSARMDCWSICHVLVLLCQLLHFMSAL